MKKILVAVIAVLVAVGIYLLVTQEKGERGGMELPSLTVSELEKILEQKRSVYENNGFTFSKVGEHYSLVANDESKVRQFIFGELSAALPSSYASMLESLETALVKEKAQMFTGMALDMDIVEDSDGAKVEVTLKMLPTQIATALQQDPKTDQLVTNFLAKGGFAYRLAMDKKGEIQGIELKDINEKFAMDQGSLTVKILDTWMKSTGEIKAAMHSMMGMKELTIGIDESEQKSMTFSMNDVVSSADQSSFYNSKGEAEIGSIKMDIKEFGNLVSILFESITANNYAKSENGFLDGGYVVETQHVSGHGTSPEGAETFGLNLQNLKMDFSGEHINIDAIETIQEVNNQGLEKALLGSSDPQANRKIQMAVLKLLQSGLKLHINALNSDLMEIKMPNGQPPLALHNFKFDLHVDLKENQLNMASPLQYIPFIKMNGTIAMAQQDLDTIAKMAPMAGMFLAMKKIVDDQAVFEVVFEEGHIKVNGTMIQ